MTLSRRCTLTTRRARRGMPVHVTDWLDRLGTTRLMLDMADLCDPFDRSDLTVHWTDDELLAFLQS